MIEIITSKYEYKIAEVKDKYTYIKFPEDYLEDIIYKEGGISEQLKEIIRIIENTEVTEAGDLISKFTNKPIGISYLSEGSKIVIYIYYSIKTGRYKKEIIDITGCGENAIEYILRNYENYNLKLFLGHYEIPLNIKCRFKMNSKWYNNTSEIE